MRSLAAILRRYHIELLVIGALRIVAGKGAAQRYIARLDAPHEDTETKA